MTDRPAFDRSAVPVLDGVLSHAVAIASVMVAAKAVSLHSVVSSGAGGLSPLTIPRALGWFAQDVACGLACSPYWNDRRSAKPSSWPLLRSTRASSHGVGRPMARKGVERSRP